MITTTVHEITIFEEDPDIYVGAYMHEWEQSDAGKFVFENSLKPPFWSRSCNEISYSYLYKVIAYFDEKTHTYWSLKYK